MLHQPLGIYSNVGMNTLRGINPMACVKTHTHNNINVTSFVHKVRISNDSKIMEI